MSSRAGIIKIDRLCRFPLSCFAVMLKTLPKYEENPAMQGKVLEIALRPFEVSDRHPLCGVGFVVSYRFGDGLRRISLRWTPTDGVERKQEIYFAYSPSNLGCGLTPYFVCPHTGRRCRKLYTDGYTITSRHSFKHCYSYQTQGRADRVVSSYRRCLQREEVESRHRQTYRGQPTRWASTRTAERRRDLEAMVEAILENDMRRLGV